MSAPRQLLRFGKLTRNQMLLRPQRTINRLQLRAASGSSGEPPRSQNKPAVSGTASSWMPYAGAGLAVGVVFFIMMGKPEKVVDVQRDVGSSDNLGSSGKIGRSDRKDNNH